MRWELLSVRIGVLAVNLVIVAILLLSFIPLAVNGMDVSLPEEEEVDWTFHDDVFVLSAPLEIYNGGYYDIEDLALGFSVSDGQGRVIADSSSSPVDLIAGERNRVNVILSMDLDDVDEEFVDEMVFDNTTLDMSVSVSAKYIMRLVDIDVHASHEFEMPALIEDYGVRTEGITYQDGNLSIPYYISASDMVSGTEFGVNLTLSGEGGEITNASDVIQLDGYQEGTFVVPMGTEEAQALLDAGEAVTITIELDYHGIKASREFQYSLGSISYGVDIASAHYDDHNGLQLPYWVDSADMQGDALVTCSVSNSTAVIGQSQEFIGLGYNHTGDLGVYIDNAAMQELVTDPQDLEVDLEVELNGLTLGESYPYGWEAPVNGYGMDGPPSHHMDYGQLYLDLGYYVDTTFGWEDGRYTDVYLTVANGTGGEYLGSGYQYLDLVGNSTSTMTVTVYDAEWLAENDQTLVVTMSFSCYGVYLSQVFEVPWEAPTE